MKFQHVVQISLAAQSGFLDSKHRLILSDEPVGPEGKWRRTNSLVAMSRTVKECQSSGHYSN